MKNKFRKAKRNGTGRGPKAFGHCVLGASLLAAGLSAHAADKVKPEDLYEGGKDGYANWIELSAGDLMTSGNANQAEQRERMNTGVFGGIEDLHYQTEVAKKTTLTVDGRAIADNRDYKFGLKLEKENLGYLRFYFENFRTWDSGHGGYSPTDLTAYSLSGDALGLDRGKISLEAVYNKEDKPKVTFNYTHAYRDGQKSSTIWGPDPSGFRLYPGIYDINETSDAFRLDIEQLKIKKTQLGLGVRFEAGRMNDAHELTSFPNISTGNPEKITDRQGTSYDLFNVHAFTETWLSDKYFLSTGFMFANLDDTFTGSRIYGDDFDVVYSASYPANYFGYYDLNGGAHKNEYVVNVNFMMLPAKNLTVTPSVRVQREDWNADSSGIATWDTGASQPFANNGNGDSLDVRERLEVRYTGVTNWVYTATADLTEGQGSLNESGGVTQITGAPDGQLPVLFRTDDSRLFQKYALNARWYPVKQASLDLGGYYKINQYDYGTTPDNSANADSFLPAYPGFLAYQGFQTLDGSVRLTLRPASKVTLVSRYEYQDSTIATRPGSASGLGEVDSSRMHSHIFGQNASWVPLNWLALQAGINYVVSETETAAAAYAAVTQSILNAQNNYWTANFNAGIVLDDKTDLNLGYYYYRAADGQDAIVNGVPLGADQQEHSLTATLSRRITKNLRWNLRYAFTHYEDFAAAGNFNFDAQVVFTSLQYRF